MKISPRSVFWLLLMLGLAATGFAQEVTMPLADFEALRKRANPPPTPTPTPPPLPAPYAFEAASLEITVGHASARVRQQFTISVFAPDWLKIPLPVVGSLTSSDLGGLEGRITTEKSWLIEVRGKGRRTITLESVVGVNFDDKSTRPTWNTSVNTPMAAACTGIVRAGTDVEEVVFNEDAVAQGKDERGGFRFVAETNRGIGIVLYGKATAPKRSSRALQFTTTAATLTAVGRTRTRLRAWVDVRVGAGQMEKLDIEVPKGFSIVSVDGEPTVGWDVKEKTLVVTPIAPVEGDLKLKISLVGPPLDRFASPMVVPQGTKKRTLVSAINVEGDGLVELESQTGFRRLDERESSQIPAEFSSQARYPVVVRDPATPPGWVITWPEKAEMLAAQIDRLLVDVLIGEHGKAAYQCWIEVRNSGADALTFGAPAGFELVGAGRDGARVTPGTNTAGLRVPLSGSTATQVIHFSGLVPLSIPADKGEIAIPMPVLSAPVSKVEFRIVVPAGHSYKVDKAQSITFAPIASRTSEGNKAASANILQQVQSSGTSADRWNPQIFAIPPGFSVFTGAWSALSASPTPVKVELEKETQKWSWF